MLALIDGDIVCYRCAAVSEKANEGLARWQADQMLARILEETNATDWKVFISGDNNFRYKLYPDYKANRRDMVRPQFLEPLREHLLLEWDASLTDGYEADDAIGMRAGDRTVICSIDKDLQQIPGRHYHFVSRVFTDVSDVDGTRNFYNQLLVGDHVDNVSGCPGIGKVKSHRNLEFAESAVEMYGICKKLYEKAKVSIEQMHLNAQLLYILRKEGEYWQPPVEQQEEVTFSSSDNEVPISTELSETKSTAGI